MDQQLLQDLRTGPDRLYQNQTTPEQQIALEQEPTSDPEIPRDQQAAPTPEGNEEALHQHQKHLRSAYPSCDLSEISYHTEQTGFPGSRHSSINTEPLTLDADQIHEAKDQAVDIMHTAAPEEAFDIFTKEYQGKSEESLSPLPQEPEAQALADQMNTLVEKAQDVVDANEQQQSSVVNKTRGETSSSPIEERNGTGNLAGLVEDVKKKAD